MKTPGVNRANKYARDVVAGRVLANKWVRLACQRHLDDLKRWPKRSNPYHFDRAAGEEIIRFIQLIPHIKGEWAFRGETLAIEPAQCFIWAGIFGWKRRDGTRRFREALILVPRKNGKSSQVAPVGLYMLAAEEEAGAEVVALQEIAFYPREASYLIKSLQETISAPCIEVPQGPAQISEPMKEFEALYLDGRLKHKGDPVLAWMASNVIQRQSRNKSYYPAKKRVRNKIDGTVAAIMALSRRRYQQKEEASIYEERGPIIV